MKQSSSQDFLKFEKIKDGVIILKDRSLRVVLMISSMNFSLRSKEEQEAIIYQFQNFLNSLDFPLQILVHSRRLNISGYLEKLKNIEIKEQNQLLKNQIYEYRKFIEELLAGSSIMQKNFYAVIPFFLGEIRKTKTAKKNKAPRPFGPLTKNEFERAKSQLFQRVEFISIGLRSIGLQSAPLNSEEVIELLWSLHHPLEAERGYFPDLAPEFLS